VRCSVVFGPASTEVEGVPAGVMDPIARCEWADLRADSARHSAAGAYFDLGRNFGDSGSRARVFACTAPGAGYS
jgi:hypothetical protein